MYDRATGIFKGSSRKSPQFHNISIGQLLRNALQKVPLDFNILIHGETGQTVTAGQLLKKSENVLRSLKALNLKDDGLITLVGSYGTNQISLIVGALLYGAAVFPTDPSQKTYEIQHIFTVQQPEIVFAEKHTIEYVLEALNNLKISPKLFVVDSDEEVKGVKTFNDFLKNTAACEIRTDFDLKKKVALIVPSSGTTGKPKGVVWTHSNCSIALFLYQNVVDILDFGKTYLSITQVFWVSGATTLLYYLSNGIPYVYLRTKAPDVILSVIEKFKPDTLFFPPSIFASLLSHPNFSRVDKSSVKKLVIGGSSLPLQVAVEGKEKWDNINNILFSQAYGATEMSGVITTPFNGEKFAPIESASYLSYTVEAKVIDLEGNNLPPNEIGEILLHLEGAQTYYANNPEASASSIDSDGFYRTGDLGYITEDGLIYITGRIKELIKSHGHQVSPIEIEDIILCMEGVEDVCVFGIAHPTKDYLPCAAVVLAPGAKVTEQDIIKEVAEKLSFPKHLHGGVKFVSHIPYNTNGKKVRGKVPELVALNT